MLLSCKEVTRLASRSLDEELPRRQRIALRLHALLCRTCARFLKEIEFLRAAGAALDQEMGDPFLMPEALSSDARRRLKEMLRREQLS